MNLPERIIFIDYPQASGGAPAPGGGRIVVEGGTASAVIDLSNSTGPPPRRGGHDPFVKQVLTRQQVTGRLRTGHTASFADQDAPIIIRESDDLWPGATYAEGRCRSCIARPFLARGEHETILILQHEHGCPVLAQLLAQAREIR